VTESGRTGFTTGTCAAAAAKAAAILLQSGEKPDSVEIALANGSRVRLPIAEYSSTGQSARAAVKKDAGDDPDVTDGSLVNVEISWIDSSGIQLVAGEGVGTVTKPGLAIPPGEPAINPVPRRMIAEAVREITDRGVQVTVSIPGGRELAEKTFNPRLGIEGGLSILGTSGIVRPFSSDALRDTLVVSLKVADACGIQYPVFVPGRIGEKAARRHFSLTAEQLVEVSNEWGFVLDETAKYRFNALLVLGHPGKLAKLAQDEWDTHSSKSNSAVPAMLELVEKVVGKRPADARTVEAIFGDLEVHEKLLLANAAAARIEAAVYQRVKKRFLVSVVLVDLRGEILGTHGDLSLWKKN
jgi:cobalt-precorrin-5B (C1)-methyltransferase